MRERWHSPDVGTEGKGLGSSRNVTMMQRLHPPPTCESCCQRELRPRRASMLPSNHRCNAAMRGTRWAISNQLTPIHAYVAIHCSGSAVVYCLFTIHTTEDFSPRIKQDTKLPIFCFAVTVFGGLGKTIAVYLQQPINWRSALIWRSARLRSAACDVKPSVWVIYADPQSINKLQRNTAGRRRQMCGDPNLTRTSNVHRSLSQGHSISSPIIRMDHMGDRGTLRFSHWWRT